MLYCCTTAGRVRSNARAVVKVCCPTVMLIVVVVSDVGGAIGGDAAAGHDGML